MANTQTQRAAPVQQQPGAGALFKPPRLPYHAAIGERFGVDPAGWRALVDAVFPAATSVDSVVLALSYCRARKLDPFKRVVHIVPVWSRADNRMVDTVWPGIGELRTTAFRTGLYAGRDEDEVGPEITANLGGVEVTYPEWCRVTVYRICHGQRVAFSGPKVYWRETYATAKRDTLAPNDMWKKRARGQLEKCAEAAALRAAFPEELGNEYSAEEMEGTEMDHVRGPMPDEIPDRPRREDFADTVLIENKSGEGHAADPHDPETGEIIKPIAAAPAADLLGDPIDPKNELIADLNKQATRDAVQSWMGDHDAEIEALPEADRKDVRAKANKRWKEME